MNLFPVPTLEKIALLKIASKICCIHSYKLVLDSPMGDLITDKVFALNLPPSLTTSLGAILKPVVMEFFSWIFYMNHIHKEIENFSKIDCNCLMELDPQESMQWQTIGLIDKYETSLIMIKDERLDTAFRFVLACNCCSENDILFLWQMLSCDVRLRFTKKKFSFLPVVNYWTSRLEKVQSVDYKFIPNPTFPYVFEFDYSFKYLEAMYSYYGRMPYLLRCYLYGTYGKSLEYMKRQVNSYDRTMEYRNLVTVGLVNVDNVAALKYFLQKFEPIRGQKLIEVVAGNHFINNEVLVFCISKMSNSQLTALLRSGRGIRVVSCFLNSPWQDNFWNFFDRIISDVTERNFKELCEYLYTFKVKRRWSDQDYKGIGRMLLNRFEQSRKES